MLQSVQSRLAVLNTVNATAPGTSTQRGASYSAAFTFFGLNATQCSNVSAHCSRIRRRKRKLRGFKHSIWEPVFVKCRHPPETCQMPPSPRGDRNINLQNTSKRSTLRIALRVSGYDMPTSCPRGAIESMGLRPLLPFNQPICNNPHSRTESKPSPPVSRSIAAPLPFG